MKTLQDTLYNWLTIKVISDARVDDNAALETVDMFAEILKNDYNVDIIEFKKDEVLYFLKYHENNEEKNVRFPVDLIEHMLNQMNEEPEKFRNYE